MFSGPLIFLTAVFWSHSRWQKLVTVSGTRNWAQHVTSDCVTAEGSSWISSLSFEDSCLCEPCMFTFVSQCNDCLFHNLPWLTRIELLIYYRSESGFEERLDEGNSFPFGLCTTAYLSLNGGGFPWWTKSLFFSSSLQFDQIILNSNPFISYLLAFFSSLLSGNLTDMLFNKWYALFQIFNGRNWANSGQIAANPHVIPLSVL